MYVLARRCPSEIARSGEEGKKVNCIWAYIYVNGAPYATVEEDRQTYMLGRAYNGKQFEEPVCMSYAALSPSELVINHYYGLATTEYNGVADFAIYGLTGFDRLRVRLRYGVENFGQFRFNRKQLAMRERHEILRAIVQRFRSTGKRTFTFMELMTELFTVKWVRHPDGDRLQRITELLLESFVASGELKQTKSYEYAIQGAALTTLDSHERQERHHQDMYSLQKVIMILTLLIAVGTAAQAGLIELPTLIDFTAW